MFTKLSVFLTLTTLWVVNLLFRWASVESTWKFGEMLGSLVHKLMSGRRRIVENNLTIVSQATDSFPVTPELIEQVFRRNCAHLTCSLKTYGMPPAELSPYITFDVDPSFSAIVAQKSGAVLCLAHMGNWEILSKIAPLLSTPLSNFGAVYRPLDNKAANSFVANQREQYGCKMFPKSTSINKLSQFIREGGILGILADQRSGKARKSSRPFFGINSTRSKLPAILHLRTKAPLFSVSVSSPTPAHWTISIKPVSTAEDRESQLTHITKSYESSFTQNLLDVFWLHRYWIK